MRQVRHLLQGKGSDVYAIAPEAPVLDQRAPEGAEVSRLRSHREFVLNQDDNAPCSFFL